MPPPVNSLNKLLLPLSLGIILTACVGYRPQAADPRLLEAQAQRLIAAAEEMHTATAVAAHSQADQEQARLTRTQIAQSFQSTATAQAWSFRQTQTAAAIQATQTAQASHLQSTQIALSLAQTQAAATQTQIAQATQQAYQAQLNQIRLERETARLQREVVTRWAVWAAFLAGALLFLGLSAYAGHVLIQVRQRQARWIEAARVLVFETPAGPVTLDPRRMFAPAAVIEARTQQVRAPQLAPTSLHQEHTTQRAQLVELASAHLPRQQYANGRPTHTKPSPAPPLLQSHHLPPFAPWRMLDDWPGGGRLPLGLTCNGLLLADPETSPHLLMAGTSGSGKTRYGLRPLITSAIADGWLVCIFDRSGLDFLPFQSHPNAHLLTLEDPEHAIDYLAALYGEVQRRFEQLRQARASTWGRLPNRQPRLLAVFDEFANLADSLDSKAREELWRRARMVAAEGRKAGIHLAIALQDPTYKSLDLRIRRNATPVAFRVRDDTASRVVLGVGGAEELPPRQFLTVIQANLHRGVAFAPSDEEIATFLERRPVPALPPPTWLHLPSESSPRQTPNVDMALVERVRPHWKPGIEQSKIARLVGMHNGGTHYYKLKAALQYLERNTEVGREAGR